MVENFLVMVLQIFQLFLVFQVGLVVVDSGWMKGCMLEVLRLFFLYQVVVGRMMFEYMQVEDMWKFRVVIRLSLFLVLLLIQLILVGCGLLVLLRLLFIILFFVLSRYLSMYLCFLLEEFSRLECQMNMLCGKFCGLFGDLLVKCRLLFFSLCIIQLVIGRLVVLVLVVMCSGLWFSCGVDGSQLRCLVWMLQFRVCLVKWLVLVSGDSILCIDSFLWCYCELCRQKKLVLFICCGGWFQFRLKVSGVQLVCGCSFFWLIQCVQLLLFWLMQLYIISMLMIVWQFMFMWYQWFIVVLMIIIVLLWVLLVLLVNLWVICVVCVVGMLVMCFCQVGVQGVLVFLQEVVMLLLFRLWLMLQLVICRLQMVVICRCLLFVVMILWNGIWCSSILLLVMFLKCGCFCLVKYGKVILQVCFGLLSSDSCRCVWLLFLLFSLVMFYLLDLFQWQLMVLVGEISLLLCLLQVMVFYLGLLFWLRLFVRLVVCRQWVGLNVLLVCFFSNISIGMLVYWWQQLMKQVFGWLRWNFFRIM